jgi:hypothetical protein
MDFVFSKKIVPEYYLFQPPSGCVYLIRNF